jgi:hypothetical protein
MWINKNELLLLRQVQADHCCGPAMINPNLKGVSFYVLPLLEIQKAVPDYG